MTSTEKILKKILLSEPFYNDGFEYQFIKVDISDNDSSHEEYNIIVNVILPKKGQSYAVENFKNQIARILTNLYRYVNSVFSWKEKILVDGKEPVKGGVFISEEKQEEVLNAMREQVKKITINTSIGLLSYNVYWKPDYKFYKLDDNYVDFYFLIRISNFNLNGKSVIPNLDMIDDIAKIINDMMYDSDSAKDKIDDVIYRTINNEINYIQIDDLFFQGMFLITHIDGIEVHPRSAHFNIDPEMFIEI